MILYPVPTTIINGDLIPSRLVATDSGGVFESVLDLAAWILGKGNEISVIDNEDGTVTIALANIISLGNSI